MANVVNTPTYIPQQDGVYVYVQPPTSSLVPTQNTSISGGVGSAEWGVVGVPLPISNVASMQDAIGYETDDPYSIAVEFNNYFDQGSQALVVRQTDGTDTSAIAIMYDGAETPAVVMTLTALCTGTRPTSANSTPAVFTLSTSSLSTSMKPICRFSINMPYANPENFDGIVAWVNNNGTTGFDMATLITNLCNAVNIGTQARGPSKYFIASPGNSTSPNIPLGSFNVTTPGTNGTAGLNGTALLGVDGINRTGMYALRGSGVGQFILCGCDDPTVAVEMAGFNESELCVSPLLIAPPGTDELTAAEIKQANNIASIAQYPVIEWVGIRDPSGTNQPRLVSPLGHILGVIASMPPEESIGNKPYTGFKSILYTEHSQAQPWSLTSQGILADNGLGYVTRQMARGGNLYGMPHSMNASVISGQESLEYTRLTYFLVNYIYNLLGQYVDELQSVQTNDPLRAKMVGTVRGGLAQMVKQGRLDYQNVTDDLTNNDVTTIEGGYNFMKIEAGYLKTMRFIIPTLIGGATVLQATAPTLVSGS